MATLKEIYDELDRIQDDIKEYIEDSDGEYNDSDSKIFLMDVSTPNMYIQ